MLGSRCIRTALAVAVGLALTIGATASPAGSATEDEDRAFVRALYVDLLGTEPGEQLVDDQVGRLRAGYTRLGLAGEVAFGVENLTQEVDELYPDALGRAPDAAGRDHWVNAMRYEGYPHPQFAAQLYGSWELVRRFGGGNPDDTAVALFERLLDRPADAGGKAHWSQVGSQRGPVAMARGMYQSLEHRRTRVVQVFQEMLGRTPSAADRDYWAATITTLGDLGFAVRLAITPEYANRAVQRYPVCDGTERIC